MKFARIKLVVAAAGFVAGISSCSPSFRQAANTRPDTESIYRTQDVNALIRHMDSRSTEVRMNAATQLGELAKAKPRDPGLIAAVPKLIELLGDNQYNVRNRAAFALGELGDIRAVAKLGEIAGHDAAGPVE
jgi:HEAT repeat protein